MSGNPERRTRRLRVLLALLVTISALVSPALAFDSFEWWGSAAHFEMLGAALAPLGFTPDAIDAVRAGADSQDVVISKKFTDSPSHHCDDDKLDDAWTYIQERLETALSMSTSAPLGPTPEQYGKARSALYTFGEGFHTLQDFYCHSNYLEYVLRFNEPFSPVDWNKRPPEVMSGLFYWDALYENEGTIMKAPPKELVNNGEVGVLDSLLQSGATTEINLARYTIIKKLGGTPNFHRSPEFLNRLEYPEYDKALTYATDGYDVLHYEIAKDSDKTMQGRIVAPDGETLWAKARALAVMDTAATWRRLEERICTEEATRDAAPWIISSLKGRVQPEVVGVTLRPTQRVRPGEVVGGELCFPVRYVKGIPCDASRNLTVTARIEVNWSPGNGSIIKEFSGLTDGVYRVKLESFGVNAPGREGPLTLKVAVTLAKDPRENMTRFAEATIDVGGEATAAPAATGSKYMWVRQEPEIADFGSPCFVRKGPTGFTYEQRGAFGQSWRNTLDWDEPPIRLRDGDRVELIMAASSNENAAVLGWYKIPDAASRNDPPIEGSLNGAGSMETFRLPQSGGSPHSGTFKFLFRPGAEPTIQVSAGHEANPGTWGTVTWKYVCVPDDGSPSGMAAGRGAGFLRKESAASTGQGSATSSAGQASSGQGNAAPAPSGGDVYLSDLQPEEATVGWGSVERDIFAGQYPIRLGGREFRKGLHTHAPARVTYRLGGRYASFESLVGLWDSGNPARGKGGDFAGQNGSVVFQVFLDGVKAFDSGRMDWSMTRAISLSVAGVQRLTIVVTNGGDDASYDWAVWGNPRLK